MSKQTTLKGQTGNITYVTIPKQELVSMHK